MLGVGALIPGRAVSHTRPDTQGPSLALVSRRILASSLVAFMDVLQPSCREILWV